MKFKVTIMRNSSPSYALQKALAVTRTPALLESVVEINIGKNTNFYRDARTIRKTPYLLYPAIITLVMAIPAMQQLHTVHLTHMDLSRMELYSILSSPYLIYLILEAVQIPKLNKFPPPKLRKLTLIAMSSWEGVEPLISQLADSLEYLELQWCSFQALHPLLYPPFPRLRELRHHQSYVHNTFSDRSRLSELFHLGSRITHLHLSGSFRDTRVAAFPMSLRHLSIEERVLARRDFWTGSFPRLLSLSVGRRDGWWRMEDRLRELPSLIREYFPGITSLQLDVQWSFRNGALVIARFQRNVQVLKLVIETTCGLDHEGREWTRLGHQEDIATPHFHESTLPAPLQSLRLDVIQSCDELERSVAPCTRWVDNDTLSSVTGLGGPDLKSVDVSFIQPERKFIPGRVLQRQWVKSIKGDWEIDKYL